VEEEKTQVSVERAAGHLRKALELVESRCQVCGEPQTHTRKGEWTSDRRFRYCTQHAPVGETEPNDYQPPVVFEIRSAIAELEG
jgi:hypothetical protein